MTSPSRDWCWSADRAPGVHGCWRCVLNQLRRSLPSAEITVRAELSVNTVRTLEPTSYPASVPANTCHASADFEVKLSTM